MVAPAVVVAIVVALIGWFATIRVISNAPLNSAKKRLLLVPSWLPWMILALGAPILSGALPLTEAFNIGGAMTIGMMVSMVIAGRSASRTGDNE